jgi:protein maelstrom
VFHFVSASSFVETSNDIFPAEIALAKFSLKEGVFDHVHLRINPGKLPLGTALEVQEKAKKYHKYPPPPNCDGEKDYMRILETIVRFFQPSKTIPILFADKVEHSDSVKETRKIIKKILHESHEDDINIKVFSVIDLFFALQKKAVANMNLLNGTNKAPMPSLPTAEHKFSNCEYAYSSTGCDYHTDQDVVKNCCLARVRFDGYSIAKWCSDENRYQLKEGRHFPETFQKSSYKLESD